MSSKKEQINKKAKKYVESVVRNFCDACNLINYFSVVWKEGNNEAGGCASIEYTPRCFQPISIYTRNLWICFPVIN